MKNRASKSRSLSLYPISTEPSAKRASNKRCVFDRGGSSQPAAFSCSRIFKYKLVSKLHPSKDIFSSILKQRARCKLQRVIKEIHVFSRTVLIDSNFYLLQLYKNSHSFLLFLNKCFCSCVLHISGLIEINLHND